ncbi:MAG: CoA-binding protein [Rhodocyclaceae bacterium]|nr:CoA-binding protein [Rhodocyclaceae bacterium]MBK9624366.1 CoA-binding protein [Rhodocyclaceae bacterium]MBL0074887.1 CoA-binding protein [Rhodocyclaceae bacterium]MBP6109317.1 CoA-binding protein [Rhodocyclaceae bacterium]MBP6278503.1 CoA-binding protein [Rhodocyclaceae bacterium]
MIVNDAGNLRDILSSSKTIAVVGMSPNPARPSNEVARYLMASGYTVIPVNPGQREILGLKCYPTLDAIEQPVDIVDVFRNSADVLPIAQAAIRIGAKCLWLQLGVINAEAANLASDSGLKVVIDRCTKIDHAWLVAR